MGSLPVTVAGSFFYNIDQCIGAISTKALSFI